MSLEILNMLHEKEFVILAAIGLRNAAALYMTQKFDFFAT